MSSSHRLFNSENSDEDLTKSTVNPFDNDFGNEWIDLNDMDFSFPVLAPPSIDNNSQGIAAEALASRKRSATTATTDNPNYEFKKQRAKQSRREVSASFQSLAQYLEYPVTAKGNRSKIIQAALNRIMTLETQLRQARDTIATLKPSSKQQAQASGTMTTLLDTSRIVYSFLDPYSLERSRLVCKDWLCQIKHFDTLLWKALCHRRWGPSKLCTRSYWAANHSNLSMLPPGFTMQGKQRVASCQNSVLGCNAWMALCRRSNNQLGRTVMINGKPRSANVAECHLVFQNIGPKIITLSFLDNNITITGYNTLRYSIISDDSFGTHVAPQVITNNRSSTCGSGITRISSMETAVLVLYIQSPLETESEFVSNLSQVSLHIKYSSSLGHENDSTRLVLQNECYK